MIVCIVFMSDEGERWLKTHWQRLHFLCYSMTMILREAIEKRRAKEITSIRADAMKKARKAAELLKAKYGVRKVILFGSLCRKAYLHKASDIDLMVEGLKERDFLHAGFDAWMLTKPFEVDIIPAEKADEEIIEAAKREGIAL